MPGTLADQAAPSPPLARHGSGVAVPGFGASGDLVAALLPGQADATLGPLGHSTFSDAGADVAVSPVDLLIVALVRKLLRSGTSRTTVLQLPRARHRNALMVAICAQLVRLREPGLVAGPVVLAALDVDVTAQLRNLTLRNYSRVSLGAGNPLSAHRLTRAGSIEPLLGGAIGDVNGALVYFNTRVGTPRLVANRPTVVIDATSITNPDARARVARWAADHNAAATVIIADLGDDDLVRGVADGDRAPLVVPVTEAEAASLTARLGRGHRVESGLSSMWMMWREALPTLSLRPVGDTELNEAVAAAFQSLAVRPPGPMPTELAFPTKLLYSGLRLAARVTDYRFACAIGPRPGEGPSPLRQRLARMDFRGDSPWRAWATARWGSLKVAVETLWRKLDEQNPKLTALWETLDAAERAGAGRVLVRCQGRAAQTATLSSLNSGARTAAQDALWDRVADRVEVTTMSARYPAGFADVQILTGAPPPWLFSVLVGAEAERTDLLAYDVEDALVRRRAEQWRADLDRWRADSHLHVGAAAPAPTSGLVPAGLAPARSSGLAALRLPGVSLLDILDRASEAIDAPHCESGAEAGTGVTRACIPVRLVDGRTWWVPDETNGGGATPVLVVTAAGPRHLPVRDLHPGDQVLVAAGEGTDSVHARLVAAIHGTNDVAALDAILGQFRAAARSVLASHPTRLAACAAVKAAGGVAYNQLTLWASGETIAPDEPDDVAAVFRAAHWPAPDLALLYQVASTLRGLHRVIGKFVAAAAFGRGAEAVAGLRSLLGSTAEELLDEFEVVTVTQVGTARPVPASLYGRIR